ncbi:MAG: TIGR03032 family protein [Proteobacteria bacterium]|nr:TIGR03032 family protein [Pseudomonadota bacterium]
MTKKKDQADESSVAPPPADGQEQTPAFDVVSSRQFPNWLAEQNISLAFTTYQAGKLFFIGIGPEERLSFFERTFNRCMGLCVDGDALWMSTLYQLWRFRNTLEPGQTADGYDALFVPRVAWTTGDIDIHDIAVDKDGAVVFVNSLFSCLATVDADHSFKPLWKPPFISKLAAEDRCHLNGLAMEDGRPRWVSAISQSDIIDGWRDRRADGGCIIDVESNEIVAEGLSMPHSPRIHDGQLWVLDSGTGYLTRVDTKSGKCEPVTFCPGYLRGLSFVGDYAVAGLSLPRHRTFSGLQLDDNLAKHDAEARCGLVVIDLKSGDIVHWLRIGGVIQELYDVVVLPGMRRPSALGFRTDEVRRVLSVADSNL